MRVGCATRYPLSSIMKHLQCTHIFVRVQTMTLNSSRWMTGGLHQIKKYMSTICLNLLFRSAQFRSIHLHNTAPCCFPLFLKHSAKYCSSPPHTPFELILFYMAPEHQQREHEGSGEGEREGGETDRGKEGTGSGKERMGKKTKRETLKLGKVCRTEAAATPHLQQECCDNQLISFLPLFLFSS